MKKRGITLLRYILRHFTGTPAVPEKTARERRLERQWADMLRYEGRPLRDGEGEDVA